MRLTQWLFGRLARSANGVGLVGDGDELDLLGHLEDRFGCRIPIAATEQVTTAGDLFRVLQAETGSGRVSWQAFTEVLAMHGCRRPADGIGEDTRLIG
ncbi:MAG: acyl carrier protein [Pseudomonadota bacterium]